MISQPEVSRLAMVRRNVYRPLSGLYEQSPMIQLYHGLQPLRKNAQAV